MSYRHLLLHVMEVHPPRRRPIGLSPLSRSRRCVPRGSDVWELITRICLCSEVSVFLRSGGSRPTIMSSSVRSEGCRISVSRRTSLDWAILGDAGRLVETIGEVVIVPPALVSFLEGPTSYRSRRRPMGLRPSSPPWRCVPHGWDVWELITRLCLCDKVSTIFQNGGSYYTIISSWT